MNHMAIPEENFENILQDYAGDTGDNGFSDFVILQINDTANKQERAKRICLYGAIFIGGLISGKQTLALMDSWQSTSLSTVIVSVPLIPIMAAISLAFTLWVVEQQDFAL